jgi:hypothetical protein
LPKSTDTEEVTGSPLALAPINGDSLTVELIEPDHLPAKIKITWPPPPSLVDPKDFSDVAALVAQLFARAHIVLASLTAAGEL